MINNVSLTNFSMFLMLINAHAFSSEIVHSDGISEDLTCLDLLSADSADWASYSPNQEVNDVDRNSAKEVRKGKRKRIRNGSVKGSCERCHIKHSKCENKRPCSGCVRAGVKCNSQVARRSGISIYVYSGPNARKKRAIDNQLETQNQRLTKNETPQKFEFLSILMFNDPDPGDIKRQIALIESERLLSGLPEESGSYYQ